MKSDDDDAQLAERATRLASAGAVGASVAHELRNALAVAESSLFLARRDMADRATLERHLDQVTTEIRRAQRVIGSVLGLARGEGVVLEAASVAWLIDSSRRAVVLPTNVTFGLSIDPPDLQVRCDAVLLERVLANLYLNAIEAFSSRGRGAISTAVARCSEGVRVYVEDDGPGVDPELARTIFDPLFTTKPSGMGLGLALCSAIVKAHGSQITITRSPMGGARFGFVLPLRSGAELALRQVVVIGRAHGVRQREHLDEHHAVNGVDIVDIDIAGVRFEGVVEVLVDEEEEVGLLHRDDVVGVDRLRRVDATELLVERQRLLGGIHLVLVDLVQATFEVSLEREPDGQRQKVAESQRGLVERLAQRRRHT